MPRLHFLLATHIVIPHRVMFKGNPRSPGARSFENIQHLLNDERMKRLRSAWTTTDSSYSLIGGNDEWIVFHLSSDAVTGLRHEIDVLEGIGLLSISVNGKIELQKDWQKRIPHMVLVDMKDAWGPEIDVHNLYCVHDTVRGLAGHWEHDDEEDEWRLESEEEDLTFDDDEYDLRKQIFLENYIAYMNEENGVGDFGI